MKTRTFQKVWYRSRPVGGTELTMKAMEVRGSLTVAPDRLEFRGAKHSVDITNVKEVSAKRAGRDFINRWIANGDGQIAMFVDGRLLRWSGILGGNRRLPRAIEQSAVG